MKKYIEKTIKSLKTKIINIKNKLLKFIKNIPVFLKQSPNIIKNIPEYLKNLPYYIKKFFKFILSKLKSYFDIKRILGLIFKTVYLLIILFALLKIFGFSYKAYLYPIRMSQYFDECSYISMGKYFRTISPVKFFTEHIAKDKNSPELYNEFNCRMVYWPIILSIPLKFTENRVRLHIFRAVFMSIGALIFFLIGHKLSGIVGGICSAIFWICTPLLNYWGHLFMTENPSYIFIAAGYLFLLYSDRNTFASFFGGLFLGIAMLTRFTSAVLVFPAPFLVLAVYFNPFKRKSFQILGEWSKSFAGFAFAVLPYFIFTWWLFRNPFVPFMAAKYAVTRFDVNDPLYYVRSLWIEVGELVRTGAILGLFAPLIICFSWIFRRIVKDMKKHPKLFILNKKADNSETKNIKKKNKIIPFFKSLRLIFRYIRTYFSGIIYYGIILSSLITTTSIYLYAMTDIPHKLPRYMMGAIIPAIIIASIGLGAFEPLILQLLRFLGTIFINIFKKLKKKFHPVKIILVPVWILFLGIFIMFSTLLSTKIWERSKNRPFRVWFIVPDKVRNELLDNGDRVSLLRLQPEHLAWKFSIAHRLKEIEEFPEKAIDNRDYYSTYSWSILNYLKSVMKHDEVFYVDRLNRTPHTPAYAEVPCMYIDYTYGYSINTLINKGLMPYKGYVVVSTDLSNDTFIDDEEIEKEKDSSDSSETDENNENTGVYYRSLNISSVRSHGKFSFVKRIGISSIYYFHGAKPFPYKFGTKYRIARLYKDIENKTDSPEISENEKTEKNEDKNRKRIKKMLHPWEYLLNYEYEEEIPPPE